MRLILLVILLWGCGDNPPVVYPTTAPFDGTKLALGPGDKLELTMFYGDEEAKQTYTLDSSGKMEVRYIGTVSAGGKTVRDVQEQIRTRLADGYLRDPVVQLSVVEINSLKCSVFGQVGHSGTIKFTPGMTIVEAIAQSGGFSPLARKNMVKVTRLFGGKKETYKIPVEMIAEGKRPNFPMMPGDEVFVSGARLVAMRVRDWVTALAGIAAVAVSIFAVGGVLRGTQAIVALLVAVSLGAGFVSKRGLARISPLVALLGLACLFTAVQLIPLPGALLDVLTPTANALREDGAALFGVSPAQTITTDRPATLGALVFFLILLGIALVAMRMATTEKGRYRVIVVIAGLCGLTALTAGVHTMLGLTVLYGFYEPQYAQPTILGPLLNANSLACLMAVGAMLGIGLAAYRRQPGWLRAFWLLVVAGCGVITVTTVSRGATLAFLAGGLMTVCVLVAQRLIGHEISKRRRARFMTNALPIGVVATCMVVLVVWLNAGNVERQLAHLSVDELSQTRSKFVAWKSAAQLVEESPWVGIGRGAFESAFTRVHPASGLAIYSHVENEYIQAVVDWGVIGALALALAAIWLGVVAVRRWRDGPLAAGALGALTVVAIQSNVEFGIEFLGLAAPLTAIAATLAYVPLREVTRVGAATALRGAHIAALGVGAMLLFGSGTTLLDEDRRAIDEHRSFATVRVAAERHPLDYYAFAVGSELADAASDPRAIRLLNHAMVLHPTHPGLHRVAARMLYRQGFVSQATIEYAAALRFTERPAKMIAEIVAFFPREEAALALPIDYPYLELITLTLTELGRSDVATLWLEHVLDQRPNQSRACEQVFLIALRGNLKAVQVGTRHCSEMLPDYQTRLAIAQVLAARLAHAEVIALLGDIESWESRVDDKINGWLAVCDAHIALGNLDDAKRCLRRLDASGDMRLERRGEIVQRLEAMQKPSAPPADGSTAPPANGSAAPPANGSAAPAP